MKSESRELGSRIITRRQLIKAAGLATAGAAIAACSPITPAPSVQVSPTTAAAATAASPTAVPTIAKSSQEIIMGIGSDVVTMDSRVQVGVQALSQMSHVLEPMMWPDNDGNVMAILASSWEPTEDESGWRFKLRPNIKFHNGEPLTAQSVKYTIDSILDEANDWVHPDPRSNMSAIKEVLVEDDLTVVCVTGTPNRTLPIKLYERHIVPAIYGAEQGKNFGQNPVGTGHYKFVEYRAGSYLRLESNKEYHGFWYGAPQNDAVTFKYLSESATRIAALEAGEVHLIDNLPPDAIDRVRANSSLQVLTTPTNRINGMFCNCGRAPFNSIMARLAVAHAIDRDAIVETTMGGTTSVAIAPFPPGTLGVVGEEFQPYEYDPEKARQYFADAGLAKGTKIRVGGPVGRYINDKQVTAAVAGMLSDVGFDPELEQLEWGTYWGKATAGEYDLFYVGWSTRGYDPADFIIVYNGWSDDNAGVTHFVEQQAQVAELYASAAATLSQSESEGYYKQLAHLLWDNVPVVQLFYEPSLVGASKRLQGGRPRRDGYTFLWDAHLA